MERPKIHYQLPPPILAKRLCDQSFPGVREMPVMRQSGSQAKSTREIVQGEEQQTDY